MLFQNGVSCYMRNDVISIIASERFKSNMSTSEMLEFIQQYFKSIEIRAADQAVSSSTTSHPKLATLRTTLEHPPRFGDIFSLSDQGGRRHSGNDRKSVKPTESDQSIEPMPSVTIVPAKPNLYFHKEDPISTKANLLTTSTTADDIDSDPVIRWSGFTCEDKSHGGYYADIASNCKYFYICVFNRLFNLMTKRAEVNIKKFLMQCPEGTAYSQRLKVCDFQENVADKCQRSPAYFYQEGRWFD